MDYFFGRKVSEVICVGNNLKYNFGEVGVRKMFLCELF